MACMAKQKSILELIHPPMAAPRKCELTDDGVDIAGIHESLSVESGEYRTIDITNAMLENFTALNVTCYQAAVIRAKSTKANMTGVQLPDAHVKDAVFTKCRINLSNFRKVSFERCAFIDCDLTEADFAGAQLTNVLFEDCIVAEADFSNAFCRRVEFNRTNLSSIKGIAGLKGATITQQNMIELAPLLSSEAGIHIFDSEQNDH